jgi:hypothetical protein
MSKRCVPPSPEELAASFDSPHALAPALNTPHPLLIDAARAVAAQIRQSTARSQLRSRQRLYRVSLGLEHFHPPLAATSVTEEYERVAFDFDQKSQATLAQAVSFPVAEAITVLHPRPHTRRLDEFIAEYLQTHSIEECIRVFAATLVRHSTAGGARS